MTRKTIRMFASYPLDGTTIESTATSFAAALSQLEQNALRMDREVLYDTLEVEIERGQVEDISFSDASTQRVITTVSIVVGAEAFLR